MLNFHIYQTINFKHISISNYTPYFISSISLIDCHIIVEFTNRFLNLLTMISMSKSIIVLRMLIWRILKCLKFSVNFDQNLWMILRTSKSLQNKIIILP